MCIRDRVKIVESETNNSKKLVANSISKNQEAVNFIERFHQTIEANLKRENFKIKDLCATLATNHVSLNNQIKKITGCTTAKYIRNYRLSIAKYLLKSTNMTTAEIAWEVGIPEASNFSNMFKKQYGKSPRAWRKG